MTPLTRRRTEGRGCAVQQISILQSLLGSSSTRQPSTPDAPELRLISSSPCQPSCTVLVAVAEGGVPQLPGLRIEADSGRGVQLSTPPAAAASATAGVCGTEGGGTNTDSGGGDRPEMTCGVLMGVTAAGGREMGMPATPVA